jgi:hypothetical protein
MRLAQVHAIGRAIQSLFAFCRAADGADFAVNRRAGAALPSEVADDARHVLSIGSEPKESMRTSLFIKVIVEHDEDESPQKLGEELCRLLQRSYVVRDAEVSSSAPVED